MTEHKEFDSQRVDICYDVLLKEGIVSPDTPLDTDGKNQLAERVVLDIHATAEGAEAVDESERNTRIKKALGFRSYLLPYFENAPVEELRKVMQERGWSTGQSIDTLAAKGLKFYAKMTMLPRQPDYELSTEAIVAAQEFRSEPTVEIDEGELVDLDDKVRVLGLADRLNRKYAQGLLVAYGKVQSTYDPQVVANTVSLALEDILRRHKFHFGDGDTVIRRFSEAYLYGLTESSEAPNFERLSKLAWQMAARDLLDDGSIQPALESTVARQLDTIYPAPRR